MIIMDVELDIKRTLGSFRKAVDQITSEKATTLRTTRVYFVPAAKLKPKKIAAIRKAHRMTQESFASALNVPRATIASIE
ncbi:MAG: helix-turn-helix transcriptional regulator [Verrucomicrobia bacterium]|nr:helix-turn-helix transcriptional regulator [Verrucomicrobiota bacterium]